MKKFLFLSVVTSLVLTSCAGPLRGIAIFDICKAPVVRNLKPVCPTPRDCLDREFAGCARYSDDELDEAFQQALAGKVDEPQTGTEIEQQEKSPTTTEQSSTEDELNANSVEDLYCPVDSTKPSNNLDMTSVCSLLEWLGYFYQTGDLETLANLTYPQEFAGEVEGFSEARSRSLGWADPDSVVRRDIARMFEVLSSAGYEPLQCDFFGLSLNQAIPGHDIKGGVSLYITLSSYNQTTGNYVFVGENIYTTVGSLLASRELVSYSPEEYSDYPQGVFFPVHTFGNTTPRQLSINLVGMFPHDNYYKSGEFEPYWLRQLENSPEWADLSPEYDTIGYWIKDAGPQDYTDTATEDWYGNGSLPYIQSYTVHSCRP